MTMSDMLNEFTNFLMLPYRSVASVAASKFYPTRRGSMADSESLTLKKEISQYLCMMPWLRISRTTSSPVHTLSPEPIRR